MSDISERTVTISWKLPKSMGGLDLTGYVIQRRDRNKYSWLHVDNVKPNIRSQQNINNFPKHIIMNHNK
jgi:hypothetical protein